MATVAFLVAHEGIEQIELTRPWQDVKEAGHTPVLVATTEGTVQAYNHLDAADTFDVDKHVSDVHVDDVDLLLLPGGVANPDALRQDDHAVRLVRAVADRGTPIAAICHAPWTLVEADVVRGRTMTSYPSLRTDLVNAGATWVDKEVVVCHNGPGLMITSRNPDDLEAFDEAVLAALPS